MTVALRFCQLHWSNKIWLNNMTWPLSGDTNVTMLLCTWLGGEGEHLPLEIREYNVLVRWLHQNDYRPGNLIDRTCVETAARQTGLSDDRLIALLGRSITLGFYLEEWQRRDYWIVGRGDAAYPKRVRQHLRSFAPPVLFGVGEPKLLNGAATAVIGPDQVMEQSNEHARAMAAFCAQRHRITIAAGKQTISAGVAESGIGHGGSVIWVLQGPVFGEPLRKSFRRAKAAGKFMMLSGRSPADKRSLSQEPEVGRIAMALCDSAMYIDGTELSGDRYCLEDAMYRVLDQRKCFVWCMGQTTAAAERLLKAGATSWIDMEMAVHEGLFEDRAEISSHEPSQLAEPEGELAQVDPPKSLVTEDTAEDESKADAGTEKSDAKKTDTPSIKVSVRFEEQLELF
ncbi:MAG: hypothetical protein F4065_10985 [Rhodothermaceae bacterium]|nr:hypothetical protein [Rhodothermaceae bacterium]MXZ57737.1 hypothetical protein [Rhodothermaceae bacterium]MYB91751.1 hypothetical protein [Rhodothermaceae bacterium]MYD67535.1 hypothetical protein [Rhodothermaceae bacterium]MYG45558.1 hypothetical protein [Rhodothermaceae bacterium]